MARFPPEPSTLSSVKMTRTAYAQLVGQKFHPPKVFGRWTEREGTKEWRWRDVGMKIVRPMFSFLLFELTSMSRRAVLRCSTRKARTGRMSLQASMARLHRYVVSHSLRISESTDFCTAGGSQRWTTPQPGVHAIHRAPRISWLLQGRARRLTAMDDPREPSCRGIHSCPQGRVRLSIW